MYQNHCNNQIIITNSTKCQRKKFYEKILAQPRNNEKNLNAWKAIITLLLQINKWLNKFPFPSINLKNNNGM